MKKVLFALFVLAAPVFLFSQPMDTSTVFNETFDGATVRMGSTTTPVMGGSLGDWRVVGQGITYDNWNNLPLAKSAPKSFHTPVYTVAQPSEATVLDTLRVSTPGHQVNHIYLEFDHICKVHVLENATIYYHTVDSIGPNGEFYWSEWKLLSFASNSDIYHGDAKNLTSGGAPVITGGKFSQATYTDWNGANNFAVPTNAWWKHELIDITSFLFADGANPYYFQLKFQFRKTSSSSLGLDAMAGWYIDNVKVVLSNCELVKPVITMQAPYYYNTLAHFVNKTGPFPIKAKFTDNDTINLNSLQFSYEVNDGQTVVLSNDGAITSNTHNADGHTVLAQWQVPNVCYGDTVFYHIYLEDSHGSNSRFDTFFVAHHNQQNLKYNDIDLDTINVLPYCLTTNEPQEIELSFVNRSDPQNSPGSSTMISGSFTMEVRNELGVLTHTTTKNWTGDICFDVPSSISMGSFSPTTGYNYIKIFVNSRNGQADGYHANDTMLITAYSCDSLLSGQYTVGGANPDFADMDEVKRSLEFCGVKGPVVFNLRAGTYQDFTFNKNYNGQSAVNTITFKGENVDDVVIVNNSTDAGTNTFGAVTLVNVKDYVFQNLTIQGKSAATSRAVFVRGNGSTNILFDGCKITANNTNTTDGSSSAVSRTTASSGYPDTIAFRNCVLNGGNYGFNYVGSSSKQNNIIIENCDITSCYRGVYTKYTNGQIKNNHIKQYSSNNPRNFSGIYVENVVGADIDGNTVDSVTKMEYAIYLDNATNKDFYVRNNIVKAGNGAVGLYMKGSSSSNTMKGYVYNNEVMLYPVTANNSYAVQINSCNNLYMINNSFMAKSDAPYANSAALYISNGNNNTYIYNNILLNRVVSSNSTNYPLYLNGNSTVTGEYNDFHSLSGVVAYKTVARNNIEELEGAISTLTKSISLLPPFVSDNSLMPSVYTGLECSKHEYVLADIRGVNRSSVTYMGAYAAQIPAVDAAVTAMVSPALGECPELSYDIAVEITNKGSETLNFASGNTKVHIYSQVLNLNQNVNINSGSVTPLNSINKVLVQNVAIPINEIVDFQFIIDVNGDNNSANDTLVQYFTLETIMPDYEENFSNGSTQQQWSIQQLAGAGNWTVQNGQGENPAITSVYGTGRLFFNSKNFPTGTKSRAILPVVTLTGTSNPIFEMWFAHDANSNKSGEGVIVKVSTDGGLTYTAIHPIGQTDSLIKRYKNTATTPEWQLYTYSLQEFISSNCIYVAIDANGQAGNNINIDRIRVRNLHNNDIAVTKVYSLGENPVNYSMRGVVSAIVRNEGAQAQTNIPVYLTVSGATEQWTDTLTIPSLAYNAETTVTFPDHDYNVAEIKDVEVRVINDQNNNNNAAHLRMATTQNIVNYADTTSDIVLIADYNSVIRPCVRYKTNQALSVTDVKYFYEQTYIADPENGFRAFVANADGEILSTSEVIDFSTLQQGEWNIIPIRNFALTNTTDEFYVGLEMLAHGDYLCAQVETPLRDSTFYFLSNGTYVPQQSGKFMIGAVVDTPFVNDIAILELEHPVSNCDLGHEQLRVQITNNGTDDIIPPVQMHYTINGGAAVSENINDTLFSHQTTTFTFSNVEDFTNMLVDIDSNYVINVWATKLAKDRLQFNDTLNVNVVSRGKSPMPVALDTFIVNYYTSGTLTAQLPSSIPEGVIGWYTKKGYESWDFHGYGTSFTTPTIFFDTMYYATANPGTVDEITVGTSNTSSNYPFVFDKAYSRGRTIYLEEQIGTHGTIAQFAYNVKTAMPATATDGIPMRIYMKCTTANQFTNADNNLNWNDELNGATLVYEGRPMFKETGWHEFYLDTPFEYTSGNLMVFTETFCGDYCSGTTTQCNQGCGTYVTGASIANFTFKATNNSNDVTQYKGANTPAQLTSYSKTKAQLNAKFMIVNLECGSEKLPIQIHVPDIPTYDVMTDSLLYPETGCAIYEENIKVKITNMLNTPIPANKVVVHAVFNGSEITQTITEPFESQESKVVVFETPFDFSAPTANINFNYTVFTTMNNEEIVYKSNDTITGQFTSKRTVAMPDSIVYTGFYTQPFTILQDADCPDDAFKYKFYNVDTTEITTTSTNMTTGPLYDTVQYLVSAQTVNSSGCWTKPVKVVVNVFRPQYDLKTDDLLYPESYRCATLNPNLKVVVTNTDTTSNTSIPANTFELKADFTGPATISGSTPVIGEIFSLDQDTITFANGINLGSQTQNRIYQYLIYSRPIDATLPVYTLNDTISGTLYIPALPEAPANLTYTVPYGETQTIAPNSTVLNNFYFYENQSDDQVMAEGLTYTTDPIYGNTTYYYSGRIESEGFSDSIVVGTSNSNKKGPLNLANGHSYAKIIYNKSDLNDGVSGRIDSIFFHVGRADGNQIGIPMKFWLKNGDDLNAWTVTNVNWNNETSNATLVYEGDVVLSPNGWVGFAIPGGFDYTGEGLHMYVEHNCGDESCLDALGVYPEPQFKCSTATNKVLRKYGNNPVDNTATSFTKNSDRWNTMFKINYTCESPKATITINTTVPQHDVGVVAITTPVTQSNNFTANETVTVTIKNFGSQSVSNIPVSYQFENAAPVTQNYTSSLASGATATMTFNTTCDLTTVYMGSPFKAYTGLSTDAFHGNDTVKIMLSTEDPCLSRPQSSSTGAHITNVTFASLNNGTGAPYLNHSVAPGNGMYSDYTHTIAPTELILGQEYPISVTHAFTDTAKKVVYKRAYIDYNRNGVFENNEMIFNSGSTGIPIGADNATFTDVVTVPTNAQLGVTRMRVICATKNPSGPCDVYAADGETEDYAILISAKMDIDLGVSQIIHPVGEVCADNNAKIRVLIKNYGTQTQTLSAENQVTVTANVTGAATGTYSTTVTSGVLTSDGDLMVVIPNVDFSNQGDYNVQIQMEYENDQYLTNNIRVGVAEVPTTAVWSLPYTENFNEAYNETNIVFPNTWTVTDSVNNYTWKLVNGPSPNNGNNGGPAHDHTNANLPNIMNEGVYATVPGQNNTNNQHKWTRLTSNCIDMHYNNEYPVEVYFYKYFYGTGTNANNVPDVTMNVLVGSGSYYQPVSDPLHKTDNDSWEKHTLVLNTIDEVARLRFEVTGQKYRIDPSIDDINVEIGYPDMAVSRVTYPYHKDDSEHPCLVMNTTVRPKVELYNNGLSAVEEFDLRLRVGESNNVTEVTEHIVRHLEPGESFIYESLNEFVVTGSNWMVWATVLIENDKNSENNNQNVRACATVDLPDYTELDNVYLAQNQPNPSNGLTRIYYSVPSPDKATIEIVSPVGQTIYTTSQDAELGKNFVDVNVSSWAAGIYYYTLRYKDIVITKKMIVGK